MFFVFSFSLVRHMTQLIFAKDTSEAKQFSKAVGRGALKRIRPNITNERERDIRLQC